MDSYSNKLENTEHWLESWQQEINANILAVTMVSLHVLKTVSLRDRLIKVSICGVLQHWSLLQNNLQSEEGEAIDETKLAMVVVEIGWWVH